MHVSFTDTMTFGLLAILIVAGIDLVVSAATVWFVKHLKRVRNLSDKASPKEVHAIGEAWTWVVAIIVGFIWKWIWGIGYLDTIIWYIFVAGLLAHVLYDKLVSGILSFTGKIIKGGK